MIAITVGFFAVARDYELLFGRVSPRGDAIAKRAHGLFDFVTRGLRFIEREAQPFGHDANLDIADPWQTGHC
jgi:hypothetical protein